MKIWIIKQICLFIQFGFLGTNIQKLRKIKICVDATFLFNINIIIKESIHFK